VVHGKGFLGPVRPGGRGLGGGVIDIFYCYHTLRIWQYDFNGTLVLIEFKLQKKGRSV
jgi:hypothetical protein